jgi:hypothetical protein
MPSNADSLTSSNPESVNSPANEHERAELAVVLESEIFKRSPKLSRLLSYLCDKYFSGAGGELKEYSIAMDVLGRNTEFDPQLDAVVRVDAHHLRKRLKQYYASEGSNHRFQIVIPAGQYTPEFVESTESGRFHSETLTLTAEGSEENPSVGESNPARPRSSTTKWLWLAVVFAAAVLAAWLLITMNRRVTQSTVHTDSAGQNATIGSVVLHTRFEGIRIRAGDSKVNYVDKAGRTWLADRYFTGGTTFRRNSMEILRTQDPEIFQRGREGQFVYEIPLDPGIYELHLYFAETGVESEALRSVSLAINGLPVSTLDVASDAEGVNTATVKIFKDISPAKDGLLHLTFQGSGPGFVNAIEVLPGVLGKMLPIRMTMQDHVYRDHLGEVWMPDDYFHGGRRSTRQPQQIEGTPDAALYIAQRFGHFSYSIPVVENGRYTVTLHFAEIWFTAPASPGGVGSRVFDVYCNGTTLLKDFDILKESGGVGNQPVIKVFHNVLPSPQGKLNLTFVPIRNYALVTAIEVSEE